MKKIKVIIVFLFIIFLFNFNSVKAEESFLSEIVGTTTLDITTNSDSVEQQSIEEEGIIISDVSHDSLEDLSETLDIVDQENLTLFQGATSLPAIVLDDEQIEPIINHSDILVASSTTNTESSSTSDFLVSKEKLHILKASSSLSFTESIPLAQETIDSSEEERLDKIFQPISIQNRNIVNFEVPTSIIRDALFSSPKIIAQWQMSVEVNQKGYLGLDDSLAEGSQILPSGQFEIDKKIIICALVADAIGADDEVSGIINYPEDVAYNSANSFRGCGQEQGEFVLSKLAKREAENMLCNNIRLNNNNLLTWNKNITENYVYGYDQVCGQEGFLNVEKASLYCASSSLAYDDPAGDYNVQIAVSNSYRETDFMSGKLKYLELTNYENDFDDIQYGLVAQNKLKYLYGDLNWGNEKAPTIRNTGNTRLQIKIKQNDFNLGKTDDRWNVAYKARVGSEGEYTEYLPEEEPIINGNLNLGNMLNVDFAILIIDFPQNENQISFFGEMTMLAQKIPAFTCQP